MTSTLRSRLMSLVLGPAIAFVLLIGATFTYGTLRDIAINEKNIHQTYAEQIAAHSYLLYRNGDLDGLQLTAQTSLEHSAIRSITFYDLNGKSIAHAGPIQPPLTPVANSLHDIDLAKNYRRAMVTLPIKPMEISSHLKLGTQAPNTEVGWVQIQFSFTSLVLQGYQSIFINLFITIILIGLIYGIVVTFTNQLTKLLRNLIKQIKSNETTQVSSTHIKEIDELQLAITDAKKQQIDKLHQAHQQLETAENDLYTTIEAIEIKNIELDMARREAVRSNKSKSEFLANTSHELRTPLNSIIGFSSLLMRSGTTQQQREHARAIHDSSQNLLVLINDILDLSRLEANRFVLNNEAFDVRDTIESTLSSVASSAHLKHLELSYSIYSDIPPVLIGDANRLRQILTNLLGNAIKFSDRGAVQLRVSLEHLFETEAVIHFEVQDQGEGLPNGKQATIFAPFTQFDNSNTREEGGTGLGLSICYKLIQQMNGDLDYHSEPGNTRFWFTVRLPIANSEQVSAPLPAINTQLLSSRLVLVDEQAQSRHSSAHLLEPFFSEIQQIDNFSNFLANAATLVTEHDTALIAVPVDCKKEQLSQLSAWCQTRQHTTLLALPCNIELSDITDLPMVTTLNKPVTRQRLYYALSNQPSITQHAADDSQQDTTHPDIIVGNASLQGVRILLADDMPNNAKLFEALLAPHGALISFAENGEQALALFRRQRFDIVMLDIQMPIMDGLQACQLMRQWELQQDLPRTPILAVTAFSDNEQRSTIEAAGMDDLLTKPIDELRLLAAIEQHIAPPQPTDQAATSKENTTTASIFSYELALKRCSNHPEVAQSMVQQLLQMLPNERVALVNAQSEQDNGLMQHIAHKLAGASSYCGTENLTQASKALDKLCRGATEEATLQQAVQYLITCIDELLQLSAHDPVLYQCLTGKN